jgi:AcrR family transcriptional regulator
MPTPSRTLTRTEHSSAGRPRSESSRIAILETAWDFLRAQAIATISTARIAKRAGVSTATLYRWWPTKEAVLLDAYLHKRGQELSLPPDGTPLDRLRKHVLNIGRFFTGENGTAVARLIAAIQDDRDLRTQFLKHVYSPRLREIRAIIKEAVEKQQLPGNVETSIFLDSIFGPLLARLLIRHKRIDESFVLLVFEQAVAAARASKALARAPQ